MNGWTPVELHHVANDINLLLKMFNAQQQVNDIDAGMNLGVTVGVDPEIGVDLEVCQVARPFTYQDVLQTWKSFLRVVKTET